jgi:transposase-like protein
VSEAPRQRWQFHLIQNAMDQVPKQALGLKILEQLRSILSAPHQHTAPPLRQKVETYAKSEPDLAAWLVSNIPESFAIFDLPQERRVKIRTSNTIDHHNQEIKSGGTLIALLRGLERDKRVNPLISSSRF